MNRLIFYKNKTVLSIMLLVAIIGSIFFLPIYLDAKYTCLYHLFFNTENPVHNSENLTDGITDNQNQQKNSNHNMHKHGEKMLNMYMSNYAFIWWSSLALAVFCVYQLNHIYKLKKLN